MAILVRVSIIVPREFNSKIETLSSWEIMGSEICEDQSKIQGIFTKFFKDDSDVEMSMDAVKQELKRIEESRGSGVIMEFIKILNPLKFVNA